MYIYINTAKDVVYKIYDDMVAQCRIAEPKFSGTVTVEQSVKDQMALLEKITPSDTNAIVKENGDDVSFPTYYLYSQK